MTEKPRPFNGPMVQATLKGLKTMTRQVMSPKNSKIGEGGDWSNLCWDGSAVYTEHAPPGFNPEQIKHKAPLPYKDKGFGEGNYQYLHVPYQWAEDMCSYRVYSRIEPGDHLWVQEYFRVVPAGVVYGKGPLEFLACYPAHGIEIETWLTKHGYKSFPSIFMPRWASRITLEVTAVRAEKVQEITEEDAIAEGCQADEVKTWWQGYRKWDFGELGEDLMHQQITGEKPPDWMLEPHRMIDRPDLRYSARKWFQILWDSLYAKQGHGWNENDWVWVYSFKVVLPV